MKKHNVTRVLAAVMAFLMVCTMTVAVPTEVKAAQKPTKITLSASKQTLYVGGSYTLKVKSVTPAKASKSVTYKTSNAAVATVSAKGKITAKKKGTATITVTSKVNKKAKATCKITVNQQVKKITVTNAVSNTVSVRIGKSVTLKTSVEPSNASSKKLTFTSNNTKVATVTSKGKITGKKAGTAKITIKSADGKAKTTITVKVPAKNKVVTKVTVSPTKKTVKVGDKFSVKATITPKTATVKTVSYKSSNEKVATVTSKGAVTAKGVGTATITVTTLDGAKKATCKVTVEPTLVTQVTLSKTTASVAVGGTVALTATVAPANATNKAVTWSSSNTAVATVADGVVTAKAVGTTTITAKAADGSGKSASCTVTVLPISVTGVTISKTSAVLTEGDTLALTATVAPANATNKAVTWSSSDATVATVVNGTVTAKKAGTAVITATAADGSGKSASCKVEVKAKTIAVTGITLDQTELDLKANSEPVALTATVAPENATDKTVTWTSDKDYVVVSEDGVVSVDTDKIDITKDVLEPATITAQAGGKTATCTVTVTLKTNATAENDYTYSYTLDKTAVSYEVTKGDTTGVVQSADVEKDIQTLADMNWNTATLRDKWNSITVQNMIAKFAVAQAEESAITNHVEIDVTSDTTMTVTIKTPSNGTKTVYVTRTDNMEGETLVSSDLKIVTNDKTSEIKGIKVTEDKENYVVTSSATAGSFRADIQVVIAKDASEISINRMIDGEPASIVTITSDEEAYNIVVNKTYYREIVSNMGISNILPELEVKNCYF